MVIAKKSNFANLQDTHTHLGLRIREIKKIKDELEKLENQWDELMAKYKPVADEVGNTAEKTIDALGGAADELKAGLERLRKLF